MRWMIIVAMLVGCSDGNPTEEIKARAAELSSGYKQHADAIDSLAAQNSIYSEAIIGKQDESLTALAAIKSQVESLASETREATDTLKASLVDSKSVRKEDDQQSALELQEDEGKESQPAILAASPPAVRLFVSHAPFACPPCERLKTAVASGEFEGFAVEDSGDFAGLRSYPAIRFETPKTTTGWGVIYGYDDSTIPTLRAMTGGTTAPVTGAIFPLQTANHVTSSRTSFRSVSRWLGVNRGSRVKVRASCSSGACN